MRVFTATLTTDLNVQYDTTSIDYGSHQRRLTTYALTKLHYMSLQPPALNSWRIAS
jgi:hypothetical protein